MPIFLDLHIAPGVSARELAEAHLLDVKIQDAFDCKAMTYWHDADKGCVFCLIEAPDKESVKELHAKSHGLVPHEVIQVNTDVVKAFLGRIQDPEDVRSDKTHLKVFSDPAFRIILLTRVADSKLLQHQLGKERAQELLLLYSTILRDECRNHGGSEVYKREEGFVMSFSSHEQALECALAIRKKLERAAENIGLGIAIHAGVPVNKDEQIFGSTIKMAQFLTRISKPGEIIMTSAVRSLFKDNNWNITAAADQLKTLSGVEESFLVTLLETLESRWRDPEFDVMGFCEIMHVSKSQLYRKCMNVAGLSPNDLIREYRLVNALELLRKEDRNIAQTTFDAGFSSPSYFTKCFLKRFGVQPLAYQKTLA